MKKGPRLAFGVVNVGIAVVLLVAVFRGLPARWWVVDLGAALVGGLLLASGGALLADHRLASRLTRVAGVVVLALGLALVAALALAASWLHGIYGPVGAGGTALFGLVALLVVPYVVVYPAALLVWVGPRAPRPASPEPLARAAAEASPAPVAVGSSRGSGATLEPGRPS